MAKRKNRFPNLELWMRELNISVIDLAKVLHLSRQAVYLKLSGKCEITPFQKNQIRQEMERRTKRQLTTEFLFKEELNNGNKEG